MENDLESRINEQFIHDFFTWHLETTCFIGPNWKNIGHFKSCGDVQRKSWFLKDSEALLNSYHYFPTILLPFFSTKTTESRGKTIGTSKVTTFRSLYLWWSQHPCAGRISRFRSRKIFQAFRLFFFSRGKNTHTHRSFWRILDQNCLRCFFSRSSCHLHRATFQNVIFWTLGSCWLLEVLNAAPIYDWNKVPWNQQSAGIIKFQLAKINQEFTSCSCWR